MTGGSGGGRGYGGPPYDDDYERGQSRPRPGAQPQWDDPAGQQGQSPRQGQPRQQGRPWQQGQPAGRPGGPQQYPPAGPQQPPPGYEPGYERGYDPRGTGPRRMADGYPPEGYQPRDAQSRQEGHPGWQPDQRDESFMPGFAQGDAGDERDPRGGRYPSDQAAYQDDQAAYQDGYDDYEEYDDRAWPGRQRAGRARDDRRGRDDWDGGQQRRPRRGLVRRLAPWVALLVIVVPLLVGGLYVYNIWKNKYHPADYSGAGTAPTVTVQVNSGDTATSLGPRLTQLGVIASARSFVLAAERSANTAGLEAGFYKLNHHMQASLAYAALLNPKNRIQLKVTIPEGNRVSQVIALLAKATSIPAAQFQQAIDNPAQLGLPSYAKGKVEGYLFPDTYTIEPNETAQQILQAMVQQYNTEAQQIGLTAAAQRAGLSPADVIIEASMVQAEGGSLSDYPKIERVILNRLHDGMKLQFDSVLLYGLNTYGINVTFKQINTPGPYNDFQHAGLPPGPITNPGKAAIEGVLHPAPGPWLFFFTKPGGKSEFSATPLSGQ